jgi:hypothetical protein
LKGRPQQQQTCIKTIVCVLFYPIRWLVFTVSLFCVCGEHIYDQATVSFVLSYAKEAKVDKVQYKDI